MLDGAEEPSAEGLKKIVEQQQVELERQKVELESRGVTIHKLRVIQTAAKNRCDDKFYIPDPIAQAAINMIDFRDGDFVLEPAKGGGAYYDKIPQHLEKDYCEIDEGISFIEMREKDELLFAAYEPPKPVDVIVTNPVGVPPRATQLKRTLLSPDSSSHSAFSTASLRGVLSCDLAS